VLRNEAVPVGSTTKNIHRTVPGCETLATTASLYDFCPLEFGEHSLNLDEKGSFRGPVHGLVEENDLHTALDQLVEEQHLIGIIPRETIRGVYVEAVHSTRRSHITEPFHGGADQGGAAVTFVHELQRRRNVKAIGVNSLPEGRDLAPDGPRIGLLVGGNPGIECDVDFTH
jgi:hypothetical protein